MIEQSGTNAPHADAEVLRDQIARVLGRSSFFDRNGIDVVVAGTNVKLSGVVRSQRELKMAAAIAQVAPGVTHVESEMVVAKPREH